MQDDSPTDSLDPAVTLWLVYAIVSVVISGALLLVYRTNILPAARLAQVRPSRLRAEVERLAILLNLPESTKAPAEKNGSNDYEGDDFKAKEKILKSTSVGSRGKWGWTFVGVSLGIIFLGWLLFGLGISWGVHGNVVAGTTGE